MKSPLISVIIPTRNEEKLLPQCLDSLTHQNTNVSYEIIVVDTNSTDNTKKITKNYQVRTVNESKKGKVFAFRKGAYLAQGSILCFTEADCIVTAHWIQTIHDYFQKNQPVVAISGLYTFHSSTWVLNALANVLLPFGQILYRLVYHSDSLRCSNFAIRNEVYKKAGGFPVEFLEFYDVELGKRVRKFGLIHLVPEMEIQNSDRRIRGRLGKFVKEFVPTFTRNILFNKPIPSQVYEHIR